MISSDIHGEIIYANHDENISILVYIDIKDPPHFIVYNFGVWRNASKASRILFELPEYLDIKTDFEQWILNSEDKALLIKYVKTYWKEMIHSWNWERNLFRDFGDEKDPYEKTNENFINDRKYPDYLPIDLPIPDYSNLI